MSSRPPGRTPLAVRFLLSFAVVFLVLIGVVAWFLSRSVDAAITDGALDQLESAAHISAVGMPVETADLQIWVDTMADAGDYRYTVINQMEWCRLILIRSPATIDNYMRSARGRHRRSLSGAGKGARRDSDTAPGSTASTWPPLQSRGSFSAWRPLPMSLPPRHHPSGVLSSSSRSPLGSSGFWSPPGCRGACPVR